MNIIELQDNLKDVSDDVLMKEMQMPSGNAPQFLVLSELKRRKRMRDEFQRREAADIPTVAEETITAAGMPQQGIMQAARAMAPKSSIAQNTGMDMAMPMQPTQAPQQPQMMADGGVLSLFRGGRTREDLYRQVQPFPENGTASERRTWNLTYGMTHNLDGTPKRMPPNEVTTDLSDIGGEGIGEVSADIKDFVADSLDDNLISEENRLDQQEIAANIRNQNLPSLSQIDSTIDRDSFGFDGNEASFDDLLYQAQDGERFPPIIEREFSNQIDFNAAEVPANILERNLADKLQFAVDADKRNEMMDRLENIDTPPPSVLGAQTDDASGIVTEYPDTRIGADKNTISEMNKILDLAGIGPETSSDVDMIDLMRQAQIEREGYGAGQTGVNQTQATSTLSGDNFSNDPTTGYSYPTDVPPLDPRMEGKQVAGRVIDALTEGEGGGLPEGIYGGFEDPEAIARKQQLDRMLALEPLGEGMQGDVETVVDEAAKKAALTGVTTGEGLVIPSEEDGGIASLLPPSLTGGDAGGDAGGDGAGGTSKGSADFGSIESRIARMLDEREKSAEADKWLSLAQTGMALMASKNPTLGGALGEAGLAGLSSMQKARSQYDKDILGLLGVQQQIESAKDLAEYRQGTLNRKSIPKTASLSEINAALDYYGKVAEDQSAIKDDVTGEVIGTDPSKISPDVAAILSELNDLYTSRIKTGVIDADVTS